MAFNYLIGNADAHAKNFSVLLADEVRLAPAYDVLSTYVYPHLSVDMATSINNMFDARAIQPIHWRKQLQILGLNQGRYSQRLDDLAERVTDALPKALDWANERGLRHRRIDGVVQLVQARTRVQKGVRDLPSRRIRGTG